MKQMIGEILSVVVAPEDRAELAKAMAPSETATPEGPLNANAFKVSLHDTITPAQKLLLATYAHLYAALKSWDLTADAGLTKCRLLLNISAEFPSYFVRCMHTLDRQLIDGATPLAVILSPNPRLIEWASDVASAAHGEGNFVSKRRLVGLASSEYEHPLDRQYLDALKGMMGLDGLVRKFYEWGLEPLVQVQYTGSNLKITADAFPQAFRAIERACEILDIQSVPASYIQVDDPEANTFGAQSPIIVFNAECFALTYDELLFVVGHELGHIKSHHCLYHTLGALLPAAGEIAGGVTLGLGSLLSAGLDLALVNWGRMSEYTADRAGLLCCQNLDAAIMVMMKRAGAPPALYAQLKSEHFLKQAREFEGFDLSGKSKMLKLLSGLGMDHPWSVMRAKELDSWVRAGNFDRILTARSAEQARPSRPPPLPATAVRLSTAGSRPAASAATAARTAVAAQPATKVAPVAHFNRISDECIQATGPYPQILEVAAAALQTCGFSIKSVDGPGGVIKARCNASAKSWGEVIDVFFRTTGNGVVQVTCRSSLKLGLIDWGKNRENTQRFFNALLSHGR